MEKYQNLSRKSGIKYFEIGEDYIDIVFNKRKYLYRYTYNITGQNHIETMKQYAIEGKGLNSYIKDNKWVKTHFKKKYIHRSYNSIIR